MWPKMYSGPHVKYPLFLPDFNETWISRLFFFSKNTQISNLVKIRPVGASHDKVNIIAFRNFANAPKNMTHIGKGTFIGEACDMMQFF